MKHRCYSKAIFIFLAIAMISTSWIVNDLEAENIECKLKAVFIEKFIKFIEWPENVMDSDSDYFTIGVIGATDLTPCLKKITRNRTIDGKRYRVIKINDWSHIDRCRVIFVAPSERWRLKAILSRTRGKPILTVGDATGYAKQGVLINFYRSRDNIRFEINIDAVRNSGLRMSSKLLRLGRMVSGG